MPTVRLVNSARRRPAPRVRRRRRNAGRLVVVNRSANSRRRRRNAPTSVVRRRRNAPRSIMRRRRSNPNGTGSIISILEKGLIAGVTGTLSRSLPTMVLSDAQNSGAMGYAANAAAGVVLYIGTKAIAGPDTANIGAIGSAAFIGARIFTDMFGDKLKSFGMQMAGDPAFTFGRRRLSGAYANPYNFVIPANSAPTNAALAYQGPQMLPAPVAPAPAATLSGNTGLWNNLWAS